jgi:hypothetical protein
MRSRRSVLLLGCLVVGLGLGASTVFAASAPNAAHLTKDCATFSGVAPTYCTIKTSNIGPIAPGTKVWYLGPVVANTYFLSSDVTLEAGAGNTAIGYCIFKTQASSVIPVGLCTFWKGTGALTGFTAVLDVTIDETGSWHWDGTYYFDQQLAPALPEPATYILASGQGGSF